MKKGVSKGNIPIDIIDIDPATSMESDEVLLKRYQYWIEL